MIEGGQNFRQSNCVAVLFNFPLEIRVLKVIASSSCSSSGPVAERAWKRASLSCSPDDVSCAAV